jgi:hypothetical protein
VSLHFARLGLLACMPVISLAMLGISSASLAALPTDPGRLFYSPAERAQLEAARARNVIEPRQAGAELAPLPQRFDGVVIRSDGRSTSWVNGQPQVGAPGVSGLKPGQIRADGHVYEPYQVLRPSPPPTATKEATP